MAFHRGVLDFEERSLYRGNAVCSFYLFVLLFYYWEVVSEVTRPDQQALLSINIRWPVWAELLDSFYSCCRIGRFTWLSTTSRIIDWSVQLPSWGCAWWVMQEKPASAVLMMTMIRHLSPLLCDGPPHTCDALSGLSHFILKKNCLQQELLWSLVLVEKNSNQDDSCLRNTHTHSRISTQVDWLLYAGFQTYCPSKRGSVIQFKEIEFLWQGYQNPLKQCCWQVALVCLQRLFPKLTEVRYVFWGYSLWGFGADIGSLGCLASLLCLAAFSPSCWPVEQAGGRRARSELESQCCLKSVSKAASANTYTREMSVRVACFNNHPFLFTRIFLWLLLWLQSQGKLQCWWRN